MTPVVPTLTVESIILVGGAVLYEPAAGVGSSVPNPVVITQGETLQIAVGTTGTVGGEPYPLGHLAVSVNANVLIVDENADGTGLAGDNSGNGSWISNVSDQADGTFEVTFPSTGSYVVTVAYNIAETPTGPDDADYTSGEDLTINVQVNA